MLIGLWNRDHVLNREAELALIAASQRGRLVISAPVYVELRAMPERTETMVDRFLRETEIEVDWVLDEADWREAANACHEYGRRRREDRNEKLPRRVAADFVIGGHASVRGYQLLTFDKRTFRVSFPQLQFAPESS